MPPLGVSAINAHSVIRSFVWKWLQKPPPKLLLPYTSSLLNNSFPPFWLKQSLKNLIMVILSENIISIIVKFLVFIFEAQNRERRGKYASGMLIYT